MTTPRTKKPTLETHSSPCCGECTFCHELPHDKKNVGCYADKPEYLYGESENAEYADYKPVSVTRPKCKDFSPKNGGH